MIYKNYIKEIDKFIIENESEFIKDLDELMSIPSVSEDISEVTKSLHWCIDKANSYGFKAEAILDNQIGIIEMGEGDETLGILTHVDVVSSGDESEWTYPPYKATVANGFVWGRGSCDDKGPLLNCLYAMRAVKKIGLPMHKKVQLIIGTQEEVKWTDMDAFVANCKLPDYSFTPDGDFPIGNREKGYADVKLCFEKEIGTKGNIEITELYGGPTINSVPSEAHAFLKGSLEVIKEVLESYLHEHPENNISVVEENEIIRVESKGVAIHSSFPEKGVNAIWLLADFLMKLDLVNNGAYKVIKFINEIAKGDFEGKPFGLARGNVYVNGEDMHKTMMSLTLLETKNDQYDLYYNIRQTYGICKSDIEAGFNLHKEKYQYTFSIVDYMDALYVDSNKPFVKLMEEIYNENTKWTSGFNLGHGTSYAKALPNAVYWGPVFPDEDDLCHEVDERVKYNNMILATKLFSYYIAEIAFSEESFLLKKYKKEEK
ncbi:MAG: Sapep family Mn(2+)-dependent dipeptidase [Sedimentibacter sp.]